ncbi:MAG: transglycosylase SLT domain-containing protein [bacterium]
MNFSKSDHSALRRNLFLGLLLGFSICTYSFVYANESKEAKRWLDFMQQGSHAQLIQDLKENIKKGLLDQSPLAQIILGKSLSATGEYAEAEKVFLNGFQTDPNHRDYWALQQVRLYLTWKKHDKALGAIEKILESPRRSLYLPTLRLMLKNHFNSPSELNLLYSFLEKTLDQPDWFFEEYDLAEKFIKVAEKKKVAVPFEVTANLWMNPDTLKDAEASDQRIKGEQQKTSGAMVVSRMKTISRLRLDMYLIKHLPTRLNGLSKSERAELGEIYAAAMHRERFYTKTLNLMKQGYFTENFSMPEDRQLYWQARMWRKKNEEGSMAKVVEQISKKYPSSDAHEDILLEISRAYKGNNNDEVAEIWWKKLLKNFPKKRSGEIAAWELAWYHYQQKNWETSLKYINEGLRNGINNPEVAAKFVYWQGKLAVLEKKQERAQRIFNNLLSWYPNTFYGMLAQRTMSSLVPKKIPYKEKDYWHDNPPELKANEEKTELEFAEFVMAAGDGNIGAKHIRNLVDLKSSNELIWKSSLVLDEYGEYRSLQTIVVNHYLGDLKRIPIKDQQVWTFAYPRPYWMDVQNFSKNAGIDPYLALAIMREESLYQADVVSPASARGLMQLMPYTGKRVAKIIGLQLKDEKDLFDPKINIQLGTSYLGQISKRFGEVIQIAGSYNAGPGRMKEWLKRFPDRDLDEFVESIPYIETRNYVKRVFRTHQLYKAIYEART